MKISKRGSILIGIITMVLLTGCSNKKEVKNTEIKDSENTKKKNKIEFVYDNVDLSSFSLIEEKQVDIDNDGDYDKVQLWKIGDKNDVFSYSDSDGYIVIKKSDGDISTIFKIDNFVTRLGDIGDITGNKIKEILVTIPMGNSGTSCELYSYNADTKNYEVINDEIPRTDIKIEVLDSYKVKVEDISTGVSTECNFNEESRNELLSSNKNSVADIVMKEVVEDNQSTDGYSYYMKDFDADGINEIYSRSIRCGEHHAQTLFSYVTVFRYDNGEFKVKSIKDGKLVELEY